MAPFFFTMDTKEQKKCKYTDTFATSDLIIKLLCGQKFLMYLEWDESFLFTCILVLLCLKARISWETLPE
jgi:hypothetical protein